MKRLVSSLVAALTISIVSIGTVSAAAGISLNHAYAKTGGTYDIVVKDKATDRLALYVNDINPSYALANKHGWATFHDVALSGTGKLSFAHVYSTSQKPINYVRYYTVANDSVTFSARKPAASTTTEPTATKTTAPSTTPVPVKTNTVTVPTPEPACTNGTYVNSAGNTVCSPESEPSAPSGATAQCVDGTYSFSQSHSGTCSHHGGVSSWL